MILKFSPVQKECLSRLFDCEFIAIPPAALRDLTTAEWAMRNRVGRKGLDEREMMLVAVMGGHLSLPADVHPEDPKPEVYDYAPVAPVPEKKQKREPALT